MRANRSWWVILTTGVIGGGLLPVMSAGTAAAEQPENLLENGGFEDGLTGWKFNRNRGVTMFAGF